MNYIDIIIAIPLIWGIYKGFKRGLILELASLVALGLGIYGAIHFSNYAADFLTQHFNVAPEWLSLSSFILTFVAIVIGIFLLANILDKTLKMAALGIIIRLAGALFGLLKFVLIMSLILQAFEAINSHIELVKAEHISNSQLLPLLGKISEPILNELKNVDMNTLKDKVTIPE